MASSNLDYINEIPIDIQISKLLDWLIDRRHCRKSWHHETNLIFKEIEEYINCTTLPKSCKNILDENGINIFSLRSSLKSLEKNSEIYNNFSHFISKLNANGIGLAHSASVLSRLMLNELTSIKKTSGDIQKKIKGYEQVFKSKDNTLSSLIEQFSAKCKKLQIAEIDINEKIDINVNSSKISEKLDEISQNLLLLCQPVFFYISFVNRVYEEKLKPRCFVILSILSVLDTPGERDKAKFNTSKCDETYVKVPNIDDLISTQKMKVFTTPEIQQYVLLELNEILYFLEQRSNILKLKDNMSVLLDFDIHLGESEVFLKEWTKNISGAISYLQSEPFQSLILLENSLPYRHRLEMELYALQDQYNKVLINNSAAEINFNNAMKELASADKEFEDTLSRSLFLLNQIKSEISTFYNNRKVNLLSPSNVYFKTRR